MKVKALLQALGVSMYCGVVGFVVYNSKQLFGDANGPSFLDPIAFLMLFCVSALTCALIVFYEPYKLFISKKGKEAVDLVAQTAAWLFLFAVVFLMMAVIL